MLTRVLSLTSKICVIWGISLIAWVAVPAMAVPAMAASQNPSGKTLVPLYHVQQIVTPHTWQDPITVEITPDPAVCFDKNKNFRCPETLGEYDTPARGVRMNPPALGEWRWQGLNLVFIPTAPLQPDTTYTLNLDALILPPRIRLTHNALNFTTFPLAVSISGDQLWVDPSPRGAHAITCSLDFSYPVTPADMEGRISLRLPPKNAPRTGGKTKTQTPPHDELKLGNTTFIWNQQRDSVTVTAPVLTLPSKDSRVEVQVRDLPRYTVTDSARYLEDPTGKHSAATYSFGVNGTENLLRITSLELEHGRDADLGQTYELSLKTSLHVRPVDMLKALKIIQLPQTNNPEATTECDWINMPRITDEDLSRGTPLKAHLLQPENEATSSMRLRIHPKEGSYILTWIEADLATPTGLRLGRPVRHVSKARPMEAELRFLQSGNLLTLGGTGKLDLHSSGLTSIHWEVTRIKNPFLALLADQSGSFANQYTDFLPLGDTLRGTLNVVKNHGVAQFSVLDLQTLLATSTNNGPSAPRGLLQITLTGFDGKKEVASNSRFLLVTSLGLMSKKTATGQREVFVSHLADGKPAANVLVQILGVNGDPVTSARTNAQGRATLAAVTGLTREKRPVALVAMLDPDAVSNQSGTLENGGATSGKTTEEKKKLAPGQDFAWLPLNDVTRLVDYAAFPTAGRNSVADGINAFVFAQRGLFRPGETLHFGCIIRRSDWTPLPANLPFKAELINPAGTVVMRRTFNVGKDGLTSFSWPSAENSLTGRYRLDVQPAGDTAYTGLVLGTGAVRVETFQPDTLSLQTDLLPLPASGWLYMKKGNPAPHVNVTLRNLYGSPAQDRRIRATMATHAVALSFAGYDDFVFHDAAPYAGTTLETPLSETRTDKDGKALLPLPLTGIHTGTMQCSVLVEGFEPAGGRAVSRQIEMMVSPLPHVLGYRTSGSGTNLNYISQHDTTGLEFVALSPELQRLSSADMGGPLTFVVSERRYVTSLVTDATGRYRYDETPVDTERSRTQQTLAPSGLVFHLPTDDAGDFLLTVRDAGQSLLATIPYTVAGTTLLSPDKLASATLRVRTDKTDYAAGDTIQLALCAPYDGAGLITLERDGVASHAWFSAKAGNSVHSLVIPPDFEGRGYVNVSFRRDMASSAIYMQPHAFSVMPITVNISKRDMGLTLTAPELLTPGSPLPVTLTSKTPGKAILFAVDEGVLQLTHFVTPSPLAYLLQDRALEVETMHLFDLLMPDHARLQGRIPGFGGGMDTTGGRFLNPFKHKTEPPLTMWSGVVDVTPDGTTVTIDLPDYYNGRVRLMAVGSSGDTAGNTTKDTTVRGSLVLTPQLPLTVAPGDVFDAFLAVADNTRGTEPRAFTLSVDTGSRLAATGPVPSSLSLAPGSETVVPFTLKANEEPGEQPVTFTITDGTRTITRTASLSIRPATPYHGQQQVGRTLHSTILAAQRDLYAFNRTSEASVSTLPLPAIQALSRYLDTYPYGCVEQLISRAFPHALFLARPELRAKALGGQDVTDAEDGYPKKANALLDATLQAMDAAFVNGRGMSMWPGGDTSPLLTAYAMDFLLTLRESGRAIPPQLADKLLETLEQMAERTPNSMADARAKAYGLWVLCREGRVMGQALEQLITYLDEYQKGWKKDVTASLLAGACSIMHLDDLASQFARGYHFDLKTFQQDDPFMTPLATQALHTAVLARHFPEDLTAANQSDDPAQAMIDMTLQALQDRGYATFSAAQALRALTNLAQAAPDLREVRLSCVETWPESEGSASVAQDAVAAPEQIFNDLIVLNAPTCRAYKLEVPKGKTLYWQVSTEGYDRTLPSRAVSAGMEVKRDYLDDQGNPITKARLGTIVRVRVTARALGRNLPHAVITDLLPGGFERELHTKADTGEMRGLTHMERREDRTLFFADLDNEVVTYEYAIRAVNRGVFAIPPLLGEAMYDQTQHANTVGGVITVE